MKRLVTVVLGGVVLAVAALLLFVATFDANRYKPEIEAMARQQLGRDLTLGGDLRLTLWPVLGLRAERISLGSPPGFTDPVFASARTLVLGVQPMPLLSRQLDVDEVVVDGLRLFLERRKDGAVNWQLEHASAPTRAGEAQAGAGQARPLALMVGGVTLTDAEVSYRDEAAGEAWRIAPLNLETGAIEPGRPFDLSLSLGLAQGDKPSKGQLTGQLRFSGRLNVDLAAPSLEARKIHLEGDVANLPGGIGTLAFRLDTDELHVVGDSLQLTSTPLNLTLRAMNGPKPLELVDAKATLGLAGDLSRQQVQLKPFHADLRLEGEGLGGRGLKATLQGDAALDLLAGVAQLGRIDLDADGLRASLGGKASGLKAAPRFDGRVEVAEFNPRAWLAAHGRPLSGLPEGALVRAGARADLSYAEGDLRLAGLEARVDDSQARGAVGLGAAGVSADLDIDRLDLDRYAPPAAPVPAGRGKGSGIAVGPATDRPIDLPVALLRELNARADLRIGQLTVQRVNVADLHLAGKARGGDIDIDRLEGRAFDGRIDLRGGLDLRGQAPAWRAAGRATGVDVGQVLRRFADSDRLRGHGELEFDLRTHGASVQALKAGLDGTARARFHDGALRGVNLGELLRKADAALKGQPAPAGEAPETDFSELTGSAILRNGVISNPDLDGKSPLLRVQGAGTIDLPRNGIDYGLSLTVVNTATGQGGKALESLRGVPVPLKVSGSLSAPDYRVDLGKVLEERARKEVERRVTDALQKKLGLPSPGDAAPQQAPAVPPVQDLLKGLLGR